LKTLTLCRHATAKKVEQNQTDEDRALTEIGSQEALNSGIWLRSLHPAISLLYHSPTVRTTETAYAINKSLALHSGQVSIADTLNRGSLHSMLEFVANLNDADSHVLFIGHYPGMNMLADSLTDSNTAFLNPSHAMQLELHIHSWKLASRGCASVMAVYAP
jgi:phosphohistidine phosphatase